MIARRRFGIYRYIEHVDGCRVDRIVDKLLYAPARRGFHFGARHIGRVDLMNLILLASQQRGTAIPVELEFLAQPRHRRGIRTFLAIGVAQGYFRFSVRRARDMNQVNVVLT